jgi:hypothetical protein
MADGIEEHYRDETLGFLLRRAQDCMEVMARPGSEKTRAPDTMVQLLALIRSRLLELRIHAEQPERIGLLRIDRGPGNE